MISDNTRAVLEAMLARIKSGEMVTNPELRAVLPSDTFIHMLNREGDLEEVDEKLAHRLWAERDATGLSEHFTAYRQHIGFAASRQHDLVLLINKRTKELRNLKARLTDMWLIAAVADSSRMSDDERRTFSPMSKEVLDYVKNHSADERAKLPINAPGDLNKVAAQGWHPRYWDDPDALTPYQQARIEAISGYLGNPVLTLLSGNLKSRDSDQDSPTEPC